MQIVNPVGCTACGLQGTKLPLKTDCVMECCKGKIKKKKRITIMQKDNRTWLSCPHPSFHDYPPAGNLFQLPRLYLLIIIIIIIIIIVVVVVVVVIKWWYGY